MASPDVLELLLKILGEHEGYGGVGRREAHPQERPPEEGEDSFVPGDSVDSVEHILIPEDCVLELDVASPRCLVGPLDLHAELGQVQGVREEPRQAAGEDARQNVLGQGRLLRTLANLLLELLVEDEQDGAVGAEEHQGGSEGPVEAPDSLVLPDGLDGVQRAVVVVHLEFGLDLHSLLDDVDRQPEDAAHELGEEPRDEVVLEGVVPEVLSSGTLTSYLAIAFLQNS